MVSTSKKGIRAARPAPRQHRSRRFALSSLVLWIQQIPDRIASALPTFAGTPRFRRELLGVVLIVIALLTAWVLGRGGDEGRLVAWWGETLVACCGRAAPLVPIFVALAALRALSIQPGPILEIRHYLGGFVFGTAVVGLLQLGSGLNDPETGGYIGVAVATVALRFLGDFGAGLALFVAGVFAVFLLAGSDLQTFWDDLRALGSALRRGLFSLAMPFVRAASSFGWRLTRLSRTDASSTETERPTPGGERPAGQAADALAAAATPTLVINLPKRLSEQAPSPSPSVVLPAKEKARSRRAEVIVPASAVDVPSVSVVAPRTSSLPVPDISRLSYYDGVTPDTADLQVKARRIEDTLTSFKVEARVREINPGPAVTQFALEPGLGIKVRRITELQNDLALALAAPSIRIEAPIPGLARVGLEIPNEQIATVGLRETLESTGFTRSKAKLPIPLGRDVNGRYVVGDLTRMPHLLIAGATGSGKSVCLNGIISTFLLTRTPDDLKLLMIDPKMVELTPFDGIPHLLRPVVTNPNDAAGVLLGLVAHMERRYKMMSKIGAKNLDQYNQKARTLDMPELPFIIIIIDELADLMITSPKEVESAIMRLAQMARATGMHLVLATQRPSVDILTSLIKVNVPARVAFAVSSGHDSRTILDTMGAERLTGMGDMLYYQPGLPKPIRLQGPFISEEEILTLANFLRRQYFDDEFVEAYGSDFDPPPADESSASGLIDWNDDKLREAAELVINLGEASVSRLQRRLSVGHARAGKLMDSLEAMGIVGAHSGSKPRDVLVELQELPNIFGK